MISACHAGYVLPGFYNALAESGLIKTDALRHLWRGVSVADCDSTLDMSDRKIIEDPLLRTAANFISRGLPTLPSISLQRFFTDAFHRTVEEEDSLGRLHSRVLTAGPEFHVQLLRSLRAVVPSTDEELIARLGKSKAAPLLKILVPLFRQLFGPAALTLLESDEKNGCLQLPFPIPIGGIRGVRARGAAQEGGTQQSGVLPDGWYQLVIVPGGTPQLQKDAAVLKKKLAPEFPSDGIAVDAGSLLSAPATRETLQLMLSPIAAARVQRALMQVLLAGGLDLAAAAWSIVIVERDIPGAALGITEFQRLLNRFFILEGKGRSVPRITATVSPSEAFADSPLHTLDDVRILRKGEQLPAADVLIDLSVLHRGGAILPPITAEARHRLVLRTARIPMEARRFLLTETQPWKAMTAKGSTGFDPRIREAVETLLEDSFRIGRVSEEQLRLIDLVLQNRSFLAALPPMSGKTLVYQFAALLQPALSFVVVPTASLAADQQDQLSDAFIDGVECQHEAMGLDVRQAARERFRDRQALFLIATSELFRNEEIEETLVSLRKDKAHFSQCVIDEAQGMSEWSHDMRPAMQLAAAFAVERLDAGKKKFVAIRLLTGSLSRDVHADLRAQLVTLGRAWSLDDSQCVVGTAVLRPQQQFELMPAPAQAADMFSILSARQDRAEASLETQQKVFAQLHGQVPPSQRIPDWDGAAALPTVLFCPFSSGTLGVSNRYAAGVAEAAVDEVLSLPQHAAGIFIGKDDGRSRVGRQCLIDAIESRAQFRRGQLDLLITTRAYGIGTHKPDIRRTMHLMPPPGIERFVQECGRGGHDGRFCLHTVLYGGAGDKGPSRDLQIGMDLLSTASGDPAREKQLIHDLMREISYPEDSNTGRIANLITDEFGIDVRISYWQRGLEERMYAQHGAYTFGYIDLVSQEIVTDPKYPDAGLAREILNFAYGTSLEAAGSGPSLSSWVAATFPADIDDGIARQIADFEPGATFTLRVAYDNDREPLLNQIHQLLWRQAEIEIQRKVLSEVQGQNWAEFRQALLRRMQQPDLFSALDPEIEERLVQLYNKIRTRGDTERIIFRLATLGVVQDYVVHPASRRFSIRIAVRADHEIRTALEEYLRLFLTERQVERSLSSLQSYPGDSMLEHCLLFLIDFAHAHCQKRRVESAGLMDALCREAEKSRSAGFRENLEIALLAKYALPWRLPAAIPRTTDRLGLLTEYMTLIEEDRSASVRENAAQLAASCELLAPSFPDEPVLPMLRAFAELVNARGDAAQKSAREGFTASFGICAGASGLEGERYLAAVADVEPRLRRYLDDQSVALFLSHLHDEVKRVKARPLPAAVSLVTREARQQAAARKAEEQKAAEQRAEEQRAEERKKAERKAAEQRAAEQRTAEQKAAERKAAERKADGQRTAEQKAGEQKAADGGESEKSPAAGKSGENRPLEKPRTVTDEIADELDLMLADLEGSLRSASDSDKAETIIPEVSAKESREPAVPPQGTETPPDPELLKHMKWLQSFNNSFLKHYES